MTSRVMAHDSDRADISVTVHTFHACDQDVVVRTIVSDGAEGLRYRAEIGDPGDIGVIDAKDEHELNELLPVAVRWHVAALGVRHEIAAAAARRRAAGGGA